VNPIKPAKATGQFWIGTPRGLKLNQRPLAEGTRHKIETGIKLLPLLGFPPFLNFLKVNWHGSNYG